MYTLVVNHMQGRTFDTVEPIVPQVLREIRRAIALGGAIVVLEPMVGWQDKSADLVNLAVQANEWTADNIRVTGVNTNSCVFSLVLGLYRLGFPRIEVIQDACNCRSSSDDDPWERYPELPGVVLLPTG